MYAQVTEVICELETHDSRKLLKKEGFSISCTTILQSSSYPQKRIALESCLKWCNAYSRLCHHHVIILVINVWNLSFLQLFVSNLPSLNHSNLVNSKHGQEFPGFNLPQDDNSLEFPAEFPQSASNSHLSNSFLHQTPPARKKFKPKTPSRTTTDPLEPQNVQYVQELNF